MKRTHTIIGYPPGDLKVAVAALVMSRGGHEATLTLDELTAAKAFLCQSGATIKIIHGERGAFVCLEA